LPLRFEASSHSVTAAGEGHPFSKVQTSNQLAIAAVVAITSDPGVSTPPKMSLFPRVSGEGRRMPVSISLAYSMWAQGGL
jgi:hypothetical protein